MKPNILHWGIVYDRYTPAVEGQIVRDLILVINKARGEYSDVIVVCESDEPRRAVEALGVDLDNTVELAKYWVQYKTGERWPTVPGNASAIVQRDLYQKPAKVRMDPSGRDKGFFLPEQGKPNNNYLTLNRPAPNGYAPVDPILVSLWT